MRADADVTAGTFGNIDRPRFLERVLGVALIMVGLLLFWDTAVWSWFISRAPELTLTQPHFVTTVPASPVGLAALYYALLPWRDADPHVAALTGPLTVIFFAMAVTFGGIRLLRGAPLSLRQVHGNKRRRQ